jgi:CRP-like cAMP-binding protein
MPAAEESAPSANAILAALDRAAPGALTEHRQQVVLERGEVLAEPDQPIQSIYFPHDCVISLTVPMEAGVMAEAATVGREGMTGHTAIFGDRLAFARSLVQVSGTADRLPVEAFAAAFERDQAVRQTSLRYTQALLGQIMQSVACGALHTAEQRLARWLLMLQDRAGRSSLSLTQEFLAGMLGVRRATVAVALQIMRERSILSQRRGVVVIRDRDALRATSCECYRIVRAHYDRVLPGEAPGMSATVQTERPGRR